MEQKYFCKKTIACKDGAEKTWKQNKDKNTKVST